MPDISEAKRARDRELLKTHKYIYNICRNFYRKNSNLFLFHSISVEDLFQDAWVKIMMILNKNKPDIRCIKSFVNRGVKNIIMDKIDHLHVVISKEVVKPAMSENNACEFDFEESIGGIEDNTPTQNIETDDIIAQIHKVLTPNEMEVVKCRFHNMKFREIREYFIEQYELKRSEQYWITVHAEACKKCKAFFRNEGLKEFVFTKKRKRVRRV